MNLTVKIRGLTRVLSIALLLTALSASSGCSCSCGSDNHSVSANTPGPTESVISTEAFSYPTETAANTVDPLTANTEIAETEAPTDTSLASESPAVAVTPTPIGNTTNTPVPTPTASSEPVTNTSIPTATTTTNPTNTPKPTSTPSPKPTNTPKPTATPTPKPTNTPNPTNTPKPTATPNPSNWHTAWGTRPKEFIGVYKRSLGNEYLGAYMHMDRYGNIWYSFNSSTSENGSGKKMYKSYWWGTSVDPMYFGQGRWSNLGSYWTESGTEWGNFNTIGGYPSPSSWGTGTIMHSPLSDNDFNAQSFLNACAQFYASGINPDGSINTQVQQALGLSTEVCNAIINHNESVILANLPGGTVAP